MTWDGSMRPAHNALTGVGASSVHNDLTSHYNISAKGYDQLATVSASSVHSSSTLKISGYEYLLTATVSSVTAAFDETLLTVDQVTGSIAYFREEDLLPSDSWFTDPTVGAEPGVLSDETEVDVTLYFEELLLSSDSASAFTQLPFEDTGLITDSASFIYELNFTELLLPSDSVVASGIASGIAFDDYNGIKIEVMDTRSFSAGTLIQTGAVASESVGTEVAVTGGFSLVAVTNATSTSNVFSPTLIVGGQVLYQAVNNPAPLSLTATSVYFRYKASGITGLQMCKLWGYNFALNYAGGHWESQSTIPIGIGNFVGSPDQAAQNALGQQLQFFGLNAAVTESGRMLNNSTKGFSAAGQFGNIVLNRQINLLLYGNGQFNPMLLSPNFKPTKIQTYQTAKGAAMAIMERASFVSGQQMQVIWSAPDVPYNGTIQEAGETGLQALAALAGRVGATLRWDGNNTYRVAYPDKYFGIFQVPSCKLIAAGGLEYTMYEDLETGLSGLGAFMIPTLGQFNSGQNTVPTGPNEPTSPSVVQIAKITKKLTSDDPPLVYDLPYDYDRVYIQILVAPGKSTGGINLLDPVKNFMTTNPQVWYEFDTTASLGGAAIGANTELIYRTEIGGAMVPQVQVDYRVFPQSNSAVDNNNFVLSLACTRKDLPSQLDAQNANARDLYGQNSLKFIKIYSGRITCMFHGTIPLPGMWGSATVDDLTVAGVIEEVQFSYPGFITIDVAQYKRLTLTGNVAEALGGLSAIEGDSSMYEINPTIYPNGSIM